MARVPKRTPSQGNGKPTFRNVNMTAISSWPMGKPNQTESEMKTVKFGSVTVTALAPSSAEIEANIRAGQAGLLKARKLIVTPGVTLDLPDDVPLFHAAPERPGYLVRVLRGKQEVGKLIKGKFKAVTS